MTNVISETGFWIENDDHEHFFSPELSKIINYYCKMNKVRTVYDFGCGTGEYLQALADKYPDVKGTGFEGSQTDRIFKSIVAQDLSKPFQLTPADLAISIEVGEHIPKEFEQTFIDNISNNSSKHLIISWAIEGQGGLGHINCQNNDYIINQFEARGWKFNSELSYDLRDTFPKDIWLKNTLMIFGK